MLPLLQKLKKLEKRAFSKLSPTALETETPAKSPKETLKMEYSEDDLKKSIAAKLQGYRPVDKEANFTGPRYMS